ncbi:carbohydrate kinase family protein [Candidatus Collierbacteria bacterium]|nr:carbohydrate kinase family protein [Candidatus Collierbacteria bacterium]
MLDVVSIGSATLDIFLKSDQFKIDWHESGVYLCEKYEGKIDAQELVMVSGGGATNSAVSFVKNGFQAAPIIEMGKDPASETILSELERGGVDLSFVVQEESETTAVSVILLSGMGGNSIVTYRGASRMLTVNDIPFDKLGMILKPGGWIYLTSAGGDMELVEKVLAWGKEKGRKAFWNPGAAELHAIQNSEFRIQNYKIDVLQLNRQEATEFFGVNFVDDEVWKAEHCPTSPETILLITDGENGGRVCLPAKTAKLSAGHHGSCLWYKGIKTKMIDSTGAGDAFGSGFVVGQIKGKTIEESIEFGKRQAANVVKFIGAKKGLIQLV